MLRLLLILGNGWADCAEIWYAIGVPLVIVYAVITVGVSLHVRTCTPRFCISETAWLIVFKVGVWGGGHYRSAFQESWVGVHPHVRTCARAHRLFHISRTDWPIALEIECLAWDPIVMRYAKVGGGVTAQCTYARASPVPLSRKPLSPTPGGAPKQAYLFHARSFIAKHGVLLVAWIKPRCQCLQLYSCTSWDRK